MRAFVTGGHGFVGPWLVRHLEDQGDVVVAPGPDVDITDGEALADALTAARPHADSASSAPLNGPIQRQWTSRLPGVLSPWASRVA